MTKLSLTEMAAAIEGGNAAQAIAIREAAVATIAEAAKSPLEKWREADEDHERVYQHLASRVNAAGGTGGAGNEFVDSLYRYMLKHDQLTPNQLRAALRGLERQEQADKTPKTPVVTGSGITITGRVVSVRERHDRRYNKTTFKMLVADDRGFRVHGTVPSKISSVMPDERVEFVATVTVSDDDPSFGFYSRPRDARVLTTDA